MSCPDPIHVSRSWSGAQSNAFTEVRRAVLFVEHFWSGTAPFVKTRALSSSLPWLFRSLKLHPLVPHMGANSKISRASVPYTLLSVCIKSTQFHPFPQNRSSGLKVFANKSILDAEPTFSLLDFGNSVGSSHLCDNMGHGIVHNAQGEDVLAICTRTETSPLDCMASSFKASSPLLWPCRPPPDTA